MSHGKGVAKIPINVASRRQASQGPWTPGTARGWFAWAFPLPCVTQLESRCTDMWKRRQKSPAQNTRQVVMQRVCNWPMCSVQCQRRSRGAPESLSPTAMGETLSQFIDSAWEKSGHLAPPRGRQQDCPPCWQESMPGARTSNHHRQGRSTTLPTSIELQEAYERQDIRHLAQPYAWEGRLRAEL